MRQPFTAGTKRTTCVVTLILVLPLGAAHLWLLVVLWQRVTLGLAPPGGALAIGAVIALLVLLAYLPFTILALSMLRLRDPVLEIGPNGLRDRRLSPDLIGWDRIRWSNMSTRGFNQVTRTRTRMHEVLITVEGRFRPPLYLWPMAAFYRLVATHPWPVLSFGTGLRSDQIASQLSRYKPPERPNGR